MAHPRRRRRGELWPAGANTPSALDWHPEARSGSNGGGTTWQAAQGCHRGSHTHTFTARAQPELSRVPWGTLHFTPSDAPSVPLAAPGGCGILLRHPAAVPRHSARPVQPEETSDRLQSKGTRHGPWTALVPSVKKSSGRRPCPRLQGTRAQRHSVVTGETGPLSGVGSEKRAE